LCYSLWPPNVNTAVVLLFVAAKCEVVTPSLEESLAHKHLPHLRPFLEQISGAVGYSYGSAGTIRQRCESESYGGSERHFIAGRDCAPWHSETVLSNVPRTSQKTLRDCYNDQPVSTAYGKGILLRIAGFVRLVHRPEL
jgi:hypothetical protein